MTESGDSPSPADGSLPGPAGASSVPATSSGDSAPRSDDSPSLDMVTAALRADSADAAIYARVLTQSLGDSLPAGCVTVDRDRTMSDRMHGRPGTVTKVTVRLGERVMTLGVQRGAPVAEVCREVRGVVLSRQPVGVGQWAAELARALVAHAEQNADAAQALRRLVADS
jgi:hypothetical protein